MGNRIVRVVDTETSGAPEDELHAICEIGWVDLDLATLKIGNPKHFFVNPGHPIPSHIRAVHHISDDDVAMAMPPDQAVALLLKDLGPDDVLCAHKASFEQAFIDAGARPWICTWKVALRAWPTAMSHSNQALRYQLDIDADPDFDPAEAMPPHRALPDARVTAHILRKLVQMRPLERLLEISAEPGLFSICRLPKHKGELYRSIAESDPSYLMWIIDQSELDADTKFTAGYWLRRAREAQPA